MVIGDVGSAHWHTLDAIKHNYSSRLNNNITTCICDGRSLFTWRQQTVTSQKVATFTNI